MDQLKPIEMNRIARDLEAWKRVEDKLVSRYGRKIVYDRDFLKAKREIYKHIRDKHKSKKLNLIEKAEMKILRGQHRNLLRQMYPNPFIRLVRNLLVFAVNVLRVTGRMAGRAIRSLTAPSAGKIAASTFTKAQGGRQKKTPEAQATGQKQQTNNAVTQANTIVRKLPVKSRVQMPAAKSKGIKR